MEFSIIVTTDSSRGIGYKNTIPWNDARDKKYFRETTQGGTVIMGRNTYESLGKDLPYRKNFIISKTMKSNRCFPSLNEALTHCKNKKLGNVFVIGGEQLYGEAVRHPLCKCIYHTTISRYYKCDTFFPELPSGYQCISNKNRIREFVYRNEEEKEYLNMFKNLLRASLHPNRTDTPSRTIVNASLSFSLENNRLPLLTTKKVNFKTIVEELLFFLKGERNTKLLEEKGITIWKGNTSKEFLQSKNLPYKEGDIGPLYGVQWRNWNGQGIDEIATVIHSLKNDPFSRRHVVSAWNVSQLNEGVLAPCHTLFQFVVTPNKEGEPTYLSCVLYQRSGDYFLGVPFNIASYSLLTHMVANITGLEAKGFHINIADCHLYDNHSEAAFTQLGRGTRIFPTIEIEQVDTIDDYTTESFKLINYYPRPYIKGNMAV